MLQSEQLDTPLQELYPRIIEWYDIVKSMMLADQNHGRKFKTEIAKHCDSRELNLFSRFSDHGIEMLR